MLGWDIEPLTCKGLQAGAAQALSFDILPQLPDFLGTLLTCHGACAYMCALQFVCQEDSIPGNLHIQLIWMLLS